jgi:hypothetical protein
MPLNAAPGEGDKPAGDARGAALIGSLPPFRMSAAADMLIEVEVANRRLRMEGRSRSDRGGVCTTRCKTRQTPPASLLAMLGTLPSKGGSRASSFVISV